MTCLEHLIENTLCAFEKNQSIKEIKNKIEKDINLKYSGITKEQCWEICQYVWCCFIFGRYQKVEEINLEQQKEDLSNDIYEALMDKVGITCGGEDYSAVASIDCDFDEVALDLLS